MTNVINWIKYFGQFLLYLPFPGVFALGIAFAYCETEKEAITLWVTSIVFLAVLCASLSVWDDKPEKEDKL